MRRQTVALTCVALPLAALLAVAESRTADLKVRTTSDVAQAFRPAVQPRTPEPGITEPKGVELDALDRKTDPCADFYQFACGGWIARNPVPADRRSYGRFTELQDRNVTILRRILEAPGAEGDRKKAADYYAACMDESKIESAGLDPVAPDLATIEELLNPDDLPVLVAHLHRYGVPVLFRFGARTDRADATKQIATVDQSGFALPDREYYLKTDDRSVELRAKYLAHIARIFALAGAAPEAAAADAKATRRRRWRLKPPSLLRRSIA
jgi:putative endopeptidase